MARLGGPTYALFAVIPLAVIVCTQPVWAQARVGSLAGNPQLLHRAPAGERAVSSAACTGPECWSCVLDRFGTGDGCDCGCTAADPDCDGGGCTPPGCAAAECDRCHDAIGSEMSCDLGLAGLHIDNDLPAGTIGRWAVDVRPGGEIADGASLTALLGNGAVFEDNGIVFEYLSYVILGKTGGGMRLTGLPPVPDPDDPDSTVSSGSFLGANRNVINWEVVSSIADGSSVMQNVFTFTAETGTLGELRFLQYLDENVYGSEYDDVFLTSGTAAEGSLELFTADNTEAYGVGHSGAFSTASGLLNSSFAGWAVGTYDNMKLRIEELGQQIAPEGVIEDGLPGLAHPTLGTAHGPADIVSVLAWDVDPTATTATIITTLRAAVCGDGVLDVGEACDDGDATGAGCCSFECTVEPEGTSCDNGDACRAASVDQGEALDAELGEAADICQAGECINVGECEAVPIPEEQVKRIKGICEGDRGDRCLAQGFIDAEPAATLASPSDAEPAAHLVAGAQLRLVPITKKVRRRVRRNGRATIKLKLKKRGRRFLRQASKLGQPLPVRVRVRTQRAGHTAVVERIVQLLRRRR